MTISIFPHTLVRYAGLPHQVFENFALHDVTLILKHANRLETEKVRLKTALCDALFTLITAQTDNRQRQQLINLKRKIFNDKQLTAEEKEVFRSLFSGKLHSLFEEYLLLVGQDEAFMKLNRELYHKQLVAHRGRLQKLAMNPALQQGLLLSSPVLLEQIPVFLKQAPDGFRQKALRMEFSLLRYLTRMAFKTSPFSTFTYTGIMQLCEGALPEQEELLMESQLKLNNTIFTYLHSILIHHPEMQDFMRVKMNRTASVKSGKIHFLVNFNNVESFQQLPATGLQLLVFQHFDTLPATIALGELIDHLEEAVAADAQSLKTYLFRLSQAGLLEIGMGISGIDPDWDEQLLDFLGQVPAGAARKSLTGLFTRLQLLKHAYPLADGEMRMRLLQDAESQVAVVFEQLQTESGLPLVIPPNRDVKAMLSTSDDAAQVKQAGFEDRSFIPFRFPGRQIFYEDCYTSVKEIREAGPVKSFVLKAERLLQYLSPIDVMGKERAAMNSFFLEHYEKGMQVRVVDFYHDYYFHVKKPEREQKEKGVQETNLVSDWTQALQQGLNRLTERRPAHINLSGELFKALPGQNPVNKGNYARAMFVQLYSSGHENQLHGVVNSVLPGMGKVSGRFLSLFEDQVHQDFLQYNRKLYPEVIKAELNDASSFNANTHPPLLDHELTLPGGKHSYPEKQQLSIDELLVSHDPETNWLRLDRRDQQVFTYDLCLESFYNRSNLYQLMAHFNPEVKLSLQPLINLVDEPYLNAEKEGVCSLPRITYETQVVIRRKRWRLRTAAIPKGEHGASAFDYFLRLNSWRIGQGIPERVFLVLRERSFTWGTSAGQQVSKEGTRDDYKPQFISFETPLLVEMFGRLLDRAGEYIIVEELLPAISHDQIEGKQIKEYLLQWYND